MSSSTLDDIQKAVFGKHSFNVAHSCTILCRSCLLNFLHPAGCGLVTVFRSVSLDLTGYVYSYGPFAASKFVC